MLGKVAATNFSQKNKIEKEIHKTIKYIRN